MRLRNYVQTSKFGGKACPHRKETTFCNRHSCTLPFCHPAFIHCKVVSKRLGNTKGIYGQANMHKCWHGMHSSRQLGKHGGVHHVKTRRMMCRRDDTGKRMRADCAAPMSWGQCHECDTKAECALTGFSKTVVVTHEQKFPHLQRTKYNCSVGTDDKCHCSCKHHIPCCRKTGFTLLNSALPGNIYTRVETLQSCCDMCTNHPMCMAWEYDTDKVCILKGGKPRFAKQIRFRSRHGNTHRKVWSGVRSGVKCLANEKCSCPAFVEASQRPSWFDTEAKSRRRTAYNRRRRRRTVKQKK